MEIPFYGCTGAMGLLASMGSFIPGRRLVTYRPQAYASPAAQQAATPADAAVRHPSGRQPCSWSCKHFHAEG
jgi:hypothetical protein